MTDITSPIQITSLRNAISQIMDLGSCAYAKFPKWRLFERAFDIADAASSFADKAENRITVSLSEWEHDRILSSVNGMALTYMGHHATGGLKDNEKADMDRWIALGEKLKAAQS